jgi:hypothetical protein
VPHRSRQSVPGILLCLITIGADRAGAGDAIPLRAIHRQSGAIFRQQVLKDRDALPYHNGESLVCSDCHVMHASLQHSYPADEGSDGGITPYPWSTTPTAGLLKAQDPIDLCLTCHDGRPGAPDVIAEDVNGLSERSAGFFEHADVMNPKGHDLAHGIYSGPDNLCTRCHWGSPGDMKVTCIDCHQHHGNGNPRNLQWASWPEGTPPLGLFNPPGMTGLARFERSNVRYGTSNSAALREVTNICIDCHHVESGGYYTDPDGDGIHSKHPSYESERDDPNSIAQGADRGSTDPAHWEGGSGSGFDGTQRVPFVVSNALDYASAGVVSAASNGVFCLSCHKAHGSASAFGLVWLPSEPTNRKGCDQCHQKAPNP